MRMHFYLPAIKNRFSIALKEFIDDVKNHLRVLEKLDKVFLWDTMILMILTRKLDSIMLDEQQERAITLNERNPAFKDFYQFLETRATYLKSFLADNQRLMNNQQQRQILQCANQRT